MLKDITEQRAELGTLCRRFRVSWLALFGSATGGAFRPQDSDLDFLVEFERPLDNYTDRYFGLLESLESLYGRPVDLVVDSAIRNPFFRQSVDQHNILLYAA